MATKRTQTVALLVVVLVLGGVVWYQWRGPAGTSDSPSNVVAQHTGDAAAQGTASLVPEVGTNRLLGPRVPPTENDRDPFRFKPKPPPPPPPMPKNLQEQQRAALPEIPLTPPVPPPPPPPPPITVKFIGIVDAPTQTGRIAVLSDKGFVFHGKEGESGVDGRFKIWKIGVESIEISYVDGRGRTTIRLSGS